MIGPYNLAGRALSALLARLSYNFRVLRTEVLKINDAAIRRAAQIICAGGLVAFPTETVYGLGADALNERAVKKIFEAKERPPDDPLIVHITCPEEELSMITKSVPERAWQLAKKFWPGPLTLVLAKSDRVPKVVTGGLETIAVRAPAHHVAQKLIETSSCPIAAPSANRFGRPSSTRAEHVLEDLNGRIELILDGGPTPIGVESTVLDMTQEPPMVLRPGGVTLEELREVLGDVRILKPSEKEAAQRSPGTRYRHYAPRAPLVIIEPGSAEMQIESALAACKRVGVLVQRTLDLNHPNLRVRQMPLSLGGYARRLFAALRDLDAQGVEIIFVEAVPEAGLGRTIMDRLRRAAGDLGLV